MKDKVKRSKFQRFIAHHLLRFYIFYLYNFNRDKLKHNLLTRQERESPTCQECGLCCVNCEAWNDETKLCNLWKYQEILKCRPFPVTPLQLKLDNLNGKCRFYWEK